ncbi:hypothetical protein M5W83_28115 [Paenibacillus thiaminolyticus]|uniref:Uncharacterized protein n=1 Tax=Paenibacillus thiaminolyticus TaxID=49283 RepID=A0AAP9DRF8_PANTH|nr:hypothetical protein [Paenibacillus thiaminolyticus]MCY9538433.1 hypothetical protein [Paenibacillus thiaminolyticus]MCY9601715.1 hypothetical protein [Paenibacillus thiaminolyticus]MCY9611015.1 hypothetical protein [Paenibacillus thiaminolyticus]MCY9616132.1 hypothetical protein [Paenibacillus thiaminolyticus]MCY9622488.1 hypothetical protein [Paenibacillus thiaminolyticus]
MKKYLSVLLTLVLMLTLSTSVFAQAESQFDGQALAKALVHSEDAQALWSKYTDEEKTAVKGLASQGTSLLEQYAAEGVGAQELNAKTAGLSDDQELAVAVALVQVDTVVTDLVTPLKTYTYGRQVEGKNIVDGVLWRQEHSIEWTVGSDNFLTYASRTATPYVAHWAIGWSFDGLTTDEQEGGRDWNYYESDVVGHYKFEVLGQPVQNQYPRIWLQGWYDGTVYYEH